MYKNPTPSVFEQTDGYVRLPQPDNRLALLFERMILDILKQRLASESPTEGRDIDRIMVIS